jgi:lysophospholipase L1-like esterase
MILLKQRLSGMLFLLGGVSACAYALAQAGSAGAPTAPAASAANQPAACEQGTKDRLFQDLAGFSRYAADNAVMKPPGHKERRVVFMGDSITEFWPNLDPDFFARTDFVGRGISGQTTLQMLLRFRADVIALKPAAVHIMAGTNDLAGNTGPTDLPAIEANIASMVDLARAHGIRVIIGSVLPAAQFPWRPGLNPGPRIVALNEWLRKYSRQMHLTYVDYYGAVTNGALGMRADLSPDGVHPSKDGYLVMDRLAQAAIAAAQHGGNAAR